MFNIAGIGVQVRQELVFNFTGIGVQHQQEYAIITSQCLIGGPATALALVSARKWDYQFEAISLGLLGYAVGNYFGFGVAWLLK